MATANCNESHSTGYKCNRARRSVPHLSPLHVGRRAETLLPRPINSFITALLLRKSPPRIITSPVISPLFSYARDNGYVANHSCASIDHTVSLSRLSSPFPLPFLRNFRFDSIRVALFSRDSNFSRFPSRISGVHPIYYSQHDDIPETRGSIGSIRRCD